MTGLFSLVERSLRSRGSLVFTLHRVLPVNELGACYNPNLALTPESLDAIIVFLKKRLPIVPVEELIANMAKPNAAPVCSLTFDDGWEDNYRIAFPILRSHSVPAIIFLPTDMIGSTALLPEERFCRVMMGARKADCVELLRSQLVAASLLRDEHKLDSFDDMAGQFKRLDYNGKMQFLATAEQLYDSPPRTVSSFFTWDHAREMQKQRMTFGSHTMRHTILSVNPLEFMQRELTGSKQRIQQELGVKADLFAYPNGMHSPLAVRAVREAGYRAAFCTARAAVDAKSDLFLLPRVPLSNDMVNTDGERFSGAMAELMLIQTYIAKGQDARY